MSLSHIKKYFWVHVHFKFCHSKVEVHEQSGRFDKSCQVLTTEPASQSRDWKSCAHGGVMSCDRES